jgi:hypothetical protein
LYAIQFSEIASTETIFYLMCKSRQVKLNNKERTNNFMGGGEGE